MESSFYKKYGLSLIFISLILAIFIFIWGFPFIYGLKTILARAAEFDDPSRITERIFNLVASIATMLVLTLFPGFYYWKFSKKQKADSKLLRTSVYLLSISYVAMIGSGLYILSKCIEMCDPFGAGLFLSFFGFFPFITLGLISIILLIIHFFKNREKE